MDPAKRKPATLSHYETLVLAALRLVVASLDEALDLDALAAPACMAPLHFHRVFRGLVGETPLQLHRRLRLERAAWQLGTQADTVLRIALDAGYDTHEAFTRAFREAFGRSPTEHRAQTRNDSADLPGSGSARPGSRRSAQAPSGPPSHRLPAACGLHGDGPVVSFPAALSALFLHRGGSTMDVEIKTRPAFRVAALAHSGPYPTISAAFERLGALAGPAGLFAQPGAQPVAIYYDDPETVPAPQLRSAAGLTVPPGVALPEGLHEVNLPAGRWACALHRGSYRGLGEAWQRLLGQWLPASGERVGPGEFHELYLNHPGQVREDDLLTQLLVPLAD